MSLFRVAKRVPSVVNESMVLAAALVVIAATGCQPAEDPMLALMDVDVMKTRIDDLGRTIDFVASERRFDQREFEDKVTSGLNRWSSYSEDQLTEIPWESDSFAEPLLDRFATQSLAAQLDQLGFANTDAWYLQQAYWLETVAKRVTKSNHLAPFEFYRLAAGVEPSQDSDDSLQQVFGALHDELKDESLGQLTDSVKIFDWIVRNIQLLPAVNEDQQAEPLNDSGDGPAAAGLPGTGYQRFAWQTLLYGRGDYVERAKLFVLMLEQLEIDAAVLAVASDDAGSAGETDSPRPWAVAVNIGDDHFLFDTRLGLPIPGNEPGQIATLADVQSKPSLVEGLDLTVEESLADETKYWVRAEQVKQLTALIYVSPEGIARRMTALEMRLTGDDRLLIVSHPGEVAKKFQSETVDAKPWAIAFQTHAYRRAVREAIAKSSFDDVVAQRLGWYYADEFYIDQFTRYRTSRARFFAGKFAIVEDERRYNTFESFQHLMYRDEMINELGANRKLQSQLGVLKNSEQSAADFQATLSSVQSQMRMVRRDAGFFLAQSHFDNGSVSTAANWLERLSSKEDSKRWSNGIRYLFGRALEGRKDYLSAIEVYREAESPQSHGDLIRARLLKQQIDQL